MSAKFKAQILDRLRSIWESADFNFLDSPRTRKLRDALLTRFLASIMTDDERARLYGLPDGCRMRENAKILSPDRLVCGEYVWIGEGAVLDASGGLEIGSHTSIGLGVYIWSHTSVMTNLLVQNEIGSPYIERKRTRIGSGVFIGGPSVVYPGVTIGDKVVVLPMSVVTSNVPSYSVVGGAPATVQKTLNEKIIQRMKGKHDSEAGA